MPHMKTMKSSLKKYARMDDANRAMCYALRNPGKGQKPLKLEDIQKLVHQNIFQARELF